MSRLQRSRANARHSRLTRSVFFTDTLQLLRRREVALPVAGDEGSHPGLLFERVLFGFQAVAHVIDEFHELLVHQRTQHIHSRQPFAKLGKQHALAQAMAVAGEPAAVVLGTGRRDMDAALFGCVFCGLVELRAIFAALADRAARAKRNYIV